MITCPNCNHQNPEGALQCEACYTPLPAMMECPACGTPVQANASFCGQCGSDLRSLSAGATSASAEASNASSDAANVEAAAVAAVPESTLKTQNFLAENELAASTGSYIISNEVSPESAASSEGAPDFELPDLVAPEPLLIPEPLGKDAAEANQPESQASQTEESMLTPPASTSPVPQQAPPAATQLQTLSARLRQVQTNTIIEIPRQLSIVRIGKPNEQTPPDIDVSGFPDSEVVSRVHANLRVEGDVYYIEDVGSSNGTYINGLPLAAGNRHRLRPGDRIALGKGDKVSFLFETA